MIFSTGVSFFLQCTAFLDNPTGMVPDRTSIHFLLDFCLKFDTYSAKVSGKESCFCFGEFFFSTTPYRCIKHVACLVWSMLSTEGLRPDAVLDCKLSSDCSAGLHVAFKTTDKQMKV